MSILNKVVKVSLILGALILSISCSQVVTSSDELDSGLSSSRAISGSNMVGTTVSLQASNGLFVCSEIRDSNAPLEADRSSAVTWETFEIVDAGDGFIAFKAYNGKYVCADKNYTGTPLLANRTAIGAWEKFTWVDHGDGTASIQANVNGKYWKHSGSSSDDYTVTAGASTMWANAIFTYDVVAGEISGGTGSGDTMDLEDSVLRTVYCDTVDEIHDALKNAEAGDKIVIAPGTYVGEASSSASGNSYGYFYTNKSGTANNPIWIVSEDPSDKALLKGTDTSNDCVIYFKGDHIVIDSIDFAYGKKGIMFDESDYAVINNCEVYDIGEEGIHVRDGSDYAIVQNCYVHDTGLVNTKYGEGIYVGSDYTKWSDLGGSYIKECDYTEILNNVLGPNVTAEHIDIKEGVTGTYVSGNTFDAEGMCDIDNGGTSFMDIKGNETLVENNIGYQNGNDLLENAFEVHDKYNGWGDDNVITGNTVNFDSGNTSSYVVLVGDLSSISGSPDGTVATDNTRSPSGNMYDL